MGTNEKPRGTEMGPESWRLGALIRQRFERDARLCGSNPGTGSDPRKAEFAILLDQLPPARSRPWKNAALTLRTEVAVYIRPARQAPACGRFQRSSRRSRYRLGQPANQDGAPTAHNSSLSPATGSSWQLLSTRNRAAPVRRVSYSRLASFVPQWRVFNSMWRRPVDF